MRIDYVKHLLNVYDVMFILLIEFLLLSYLLFDSNTACTYSKIPFYTSTAQYQMFQICKAGKWLDVCDYRWTQSHSIVAVNSFMQ